MGRGKQEVSLSLPTRGSTERHELPPSGPAETDSSAFQVHRMPLVGMLLQNTGDRACAGRLMFVEFGGAGPAGAGSPPLNTPLILR